MIRSLSCCSRDSGLRYFRISLLIPSVHELASHTTGSWPQLVHRQSLSITCFAAYRPASSNPLDCHTVEQQVPSRSSGIHRESPARADTFTRASASDNSPLLKIRFTHAWKYTASHPARDVPGNLASAAEGIFGRQAGIRSMLTTERRALNALSATREPPGRLVAIRFTRSAVRATVSMLFQFRAIPTARCSLILLCS